MMLDRLGHWIIFLWLSCYARALPITEQEANCWSCQQKDTCFFLLSATKDLYLQKLLKDISWMAILLLPFCCLFNQLLLNG